MAKEKYVQEQSLNAWLQMLHTIYGSTQNYSKSPFEILSHLTEVCGVLGKFLFKKKDNETARLFLPKMFAWSGALLRSIQPREADAERIILQKFPNVCAYCLRQPCECWAGAKPSPNPDRLRQLYYDNAPARQRGVNDFELMFVSIYGQTWSGSAENAEPNSAIRYVYLRMIEELAELGEAVRFHHLYPKNFENELADFFAWWFALASLIRNSSSDRSIQTDELLWRAYPGQCIDCQSVPCFCPPGPVRDLMSKPVPGQHQDFDALTTLRNQGAYNDDLEAIISGEIAFLWPASCVRIDVDDFKKVNDTHGHDAGDSALRHVATVLRSKARPKDRVYRISGDEFGVFMPDSTEEEAFGLMKRVSNTLNSQVVRWTSAEGVVAEFIVTVSVGVAECAAATDIKIGFKKADDAAYKSKSEGKNRVTRATSMQSAQLDGGKQNSGGS